MALAINPAGVMPARGEAAAASAKARAVWIRIMPVVILTYSYLLFPPEVRLVIGGINFPLYRILIIALLPTTVLRTFAGSFRFVLSDFLTLIASSWMMISFIAYYGAGVGFSRSAALVIDTAGTYLVVRGAVRNPDDLRRVLVLVAPALLIAGAELMLESVSRKLLVRPTFARIFGSLSTYDNGEAAATLSFRQDLRLGLLRAFGPFSHPILAGVIMTSFLPLFWTSGIKGWPWKIGLAAACLGIFSLSSSAILLIVISIGILSADAVKRRSVGISWWLISLMTVIAMLFVEFASKSGLVPILLRMTLDPQTGYYRLIIWEYGLKSIANFPLFGIGFTGYERAPFLSSSIDAHFLLLGVRHGIVVPVALFAAVILALIGVGRNVKNVSPANRILLIGINTALLGALIASMTVTFFGEANIWFMTNLAFAGSLSSFGKGDA